MNRTLTTVALLLLCGCFPARRVTPVDELQVLTLQHDYSNTHAVVFDGKVVLIDSGLERNAKLLADDLAAEGLSPESVVAVVLTHGHADHAGGAHYFREKYGAKVVAGRGDAPMLAAGMNEKLCPTNSDAQSRLEADQAERYQPYEADVLVDAPLALSQVSPEARGEVLPLPGHTAGSLAVKVGHALFVGDLLRGGVFTRSAEVHFYMCDVEANRRDIAALLAAHPDVTTWFVGHFGPLSRADIAAKFAAR
ncbi:MAG: MBL fold metallo-hydrolase [Myxococcaceae bacterium]|nr:MBL fold metallo-hydrolase [Myxococcaceae bacterium]